jgi:hypothetical protein
MQELIRNSWRNGALYTLLLLGCTGAGLGLFRLYQVHTTEIVETATVYFEIKAISAGGHPQSGAEVYLQNKLVGLTDSFGEWHGFKKAGIGLDASIKITKKNPNGVSYGVTKAVPIPSAPRTGEIKVIKTFQLAVART